MFYIPTTGGSLLGSSQPAYQKSGVAARMGISKKNGDGDAHARPSATATNEPMNNSHSGLIVLSRVIQWTMALVIRDTAR